MRTITSRTNEIIKQARALQQAKARHAQRLHLAESDKLVREAISSGASICRLFMEDGYPLPEAALAMDEAYTVSRSVMESLCESITPQHACAVVRTPDTRPPERYPDGLVVVLDCVQDAGNVGTILRTADAFGAVGLFCGTGCADPFSGKALRAAMGSTYHLPVWQGDAADALDRLCVQGFTCVCGHLRGSECLPPVTGRMALVIGNEGNGVSDDVASRCALYRLPMRGRAESLNAAMAAGIMIYEFTGQMERRIP